MEVRALFGPFSFKIGICADPHQLPWILMNDWKCARKKALRWLKASILWTRDDKGHVSPCLLHQSVDHALVLVPAISEYHPGVLLTPRPNAVCYWLLLAYRDLNICRKTGSNLQIAPNFTKIPKLRWVNSILPH